MFPRSAQLRCANRVRDFFVCDRNTAAPATPVPAVLFCGQDIQPANVSCIVARVLWLQCCSPVRRRCCCGARDAPRRDPVHLRASARMVDRGCGSIRAPGHLDCRRPRWPPVRRVVRRAARVHIRVKGGLLELDAGTRHRARSARRARGGGGTRSCRERLWARWGRRGAAAVHG